MKFTTGLLTVAAVLTTPAFADLLFFTPEPVPDNDDGYMGVLPSNTFKDLNEPAGYQNESGVIYVAETLAIVYNGNYTYYICQQYLVAMCIYALFCAFILFVLTTCLHIFI